MVRVPNQLWCRAAMAVCVLSIAGEAAAGICVDVDLTFAGREPQEATVRSMQDEASAIWIRYGVQIQWPASLLEVHCPVVLGSFDVFVEYQHSPTTHPRGPIVLGSTRLVPARIDHVGIHLDYDETQSLIESVGDSRLLVLAGSPVIGPVEIGRALGRILAHEIGHVLLGVRRHQAFGLMRPSFTPTDLVTRQRGAYALSTKEVERLAVRESELREYQHSAPPIHF